MMRLLKLYRYINVLSIDVALGAVCSAHFFAWILELTLRAYAFIALGLTVWIIYTIDHLLDAGSTYTTASTHRHRFHQKYYSALWYWVVLAIAADGVTLFFIRKPILAGGIALALIVGVYLWWLRHLPLLKELFIAGLYTAGVLLPANMVSDVTFDRMPWVLIIQFGLTAFINLLLFSWFDYANDLKDGHFSFATTLGERLTWKIIMVLFTVVFALSLWAIPLKASYLLVAMNLVLLIMFLRREFFCEADRFRVLGDAIFYIPVFYKWM
jgi:4-hydroxybenzoate polyprenyltransferase